jgi:hypothetical protein
LRRRNLKIINYKEEQRRNYDYDYDCTNLKTPGGYIAKSKSQGVCLQLSQTPGGDYAIWPFFFLC